MCFKVDINSVGFVGYFTQKISYISIIHLISLEDRRLKILLSFKINIELHVSRDVLESEIPVHWKEGR